MLALCRCAASIVLADAADLQPPDLYATRISLGDQVVWRMKFVADTQANARRLACWTLANDFSLEFVDVAVDYGTSGHYVTRTLDEAATFRGYPTAVRTDVNCRAFTRAAIDDGEAAQLRPANSACKGAASGRSHLVSTAVAATAKMRDRF